MPRCWRFRSREFLRDYSRFAFQILLLQDPSRTYDCGVVRYETSVPDFFEYVEVFERLKLLKFAFQHLSFRQRRNDCVGNVKSFLLHPRILRQRHELLQTISLFTDKTNTLLLIHNFDTTLLWRQNWSIDWGNSPIVDIPLQRWTRGHRNDTRRRRRR